MTDNILTAFILTIMIIAIFVGAFYGEYQAEECKLKAIEHNVPVLEIKELCK